MSWAHSSQASYSYAPPSRGASGSQLWWGWTKEWVSSLEKNGGLMGFHQSMDWFKGTFTGNLLVFTIKYGVFL